MNLQEYDKLPDDYEKISQVQYTVSQICAASKSQVYKHSSKLRLKLIFLNLNILIN